MVGTTLCKKNYGSAVGGLCCNKTDHVKGE